MNLKPGQTYYLVDEFGSLYSIVYVGPFTNNYIPDYEVFYMWNDSDDLDNYEFIYLDFKLKKFAYFSDTEEFMDIKFFTLYERAKEECNRINEIRELRQKARELTDEQLLELLRGKV